MHINRRTALTTAAMGGLTLVAGLSAAEAAERHPKIRQAIRALEQAKDDLQHADHDFGGHRVDAIKECDEAIRQLKLALQYDKK
jgi:hypothetical protein